VDSQVVTPVSVARPRIGMRLRIVSLLAPLTVAAGIGWALVQPYRLTLLHPRGQGFWWLAVEPPLLVCFAGIVFGVFVARPLIADLEGDSGTTE